MNIDIPIYIEGYLDGQYKGDRGKGIVVRKENFFGRARKYSINLYKDLHIIKATSIDEVQYKNTVTNPNWWKINHSADAAIDFLKPFFKEYTFLRHRPVEIFVETPNIHLVDKRNGNQRTYGKLTGRVVAKLVNPVKPVIKQPTSTQPIIPTQPLENIINKPLPPKAGCFDNYSSRINGCFGMRDGVSGTGGCYGLRGGPLGLRGLSGAYGNPNGCFQPTTSQGCFPNLGLGCLLPLLFLGLLLFALFKSCENVRTLDPIVNTIKKDRDDSRIPPPLWVNDNDTAQAEPDYVPLTEDTTSLAIDTSQILVDTLINVDTVNHEQDSLRKSIKKGQVLFEVWDWDRADRDSVSLYLNNRLVRENIVLRKKPYRFIENGLRYGENYLEVRAVNTQKGSNTAAIRGFSDRGKLCDTTLIQSTSDIKRLTLNYQ